MENNSNKRVLAYELATEISEEELKNVSGGVGKVTVNLTHNAGGLQDLSTDLVLDN
ncbi:MAG: bacteriocin [Legionellaceae bacterium]|nr:bacteriocin [Legionellaceae bacterium]